MRPATAVRTQMGGGEFLASLDPALEPALRAAVGESFRVVQQWSGGGSDCALLLLDGGRRLILKRAKPGAPFEYESATLSRLQSSAIEGMLPRLVENLPEQRAMLLEFVGARDTRSALRAGAVPQRLARDIARALKSYHRQMECAFGDFHPANVLVDAGGCRFIDPAPPNWHGGRIGQPPEVTDLALWTYSTAANLLWDARRSPRLAWKMLRLNVDLLRIGLAGSEPSAHRELGAEVRRHLRALWRGWPRDKVVFVAASAVSWAVLFAARRLPAASSLAQDAVQPVREPQG